MSAEALQAHYQAILDRAGAGALRAVADLRALHLPAHVPPWTDTGMEIAAGDDVTLLASGRVVLSEDLDLWGGPRLYLWGRIGERGTIFNPTRDTTTVRAAESGRLHLAIYSGEWANRQGDLATPIDGYAALRGGIDVVAIRWRDGAEAGMAALGTERSGDPWLAAEAARRAAPVEPPKGWDYLWFLGRADVFTRARSGGRDAIALRAENDVGILRRPVDFPLSFDTELSWSWRVLELPSARAEDTLPTHDYLSVALEFDDGTDLTWYWSAALPVGNAYACPLPHWNARETHLVVRSGKEGLGAWCAERRNVLSDWRHAVARSEPPARITAVWLIAVSLFQHGNAVAEVADLSLSGGGRRVRVD
ncbi:MAG TPA: DUF3047 domain-containing protein [Myxococcota bacterium]|nr:DUF3047 domain-containing protein [Myxococcota bacterium]